MPYHENLRRPLFIANILLQKNYFLSILGLKCKSALFRHEIAYVLGQMQHDACIKQLTENLKDPVENPMVRHECAEALGNVQRNLFTFI